MPWRVYTVETRAGHRLVVMFVDGTAGEVHLQEFLEGPSVNGTVFEVLRDEKHFAQARVELGAVTWPSGVDLAPDAMYDAIRTHGCWTVEA